MYFCVSVCLSVRIRKICNVNRSVLKLQKRYLHQNGVEKNEDTVDQSKLMSSCCLLCLCARVWQKIQNLKKKKARNPSLKFEKLAAIFLFNSKGKKQVELLGEKRKKVRKKTENIQKLPKIYKYFSVKQDLGENEPNQAQLYPTKTPPITTTMDRHKTEDKGGRLTRSKNSSQSEKKP